MTNQTRVPSSNNPLKYFAQDGSGSFRYRYILFIISLVLTVAAAETILQYDLKQQTPDAHLISIAGRQIMLSQRISKFALIIYFNSPKNNALNDYRFDSLQRLIDSWERIHYYLIEENQNERKSQAIDSQLKDNTKSLRQTVSSCRAMIKNRDSLTMKAAIDQIANADYPYLMKMEKTVATYQEESEQKLHELKLKAFILGGVAIIIFVGGFVFIVLPILVQLQNRNRKLTMSNSDLATSEEEIRSNMEQIHELQVNLEIKQQQYQSLVDEATDMIYELSPEGKFSFINPVFEIISGFSKEELLGKPYWDLICEEDVNSAVGFYNEQRKKNQEVSYCEFRMETKSGKKIWIGQNARMFYNERWIYKVSVVARDITKIKETEAALSIERILLRTIIDNIPINIYAKNIKSEKILANKAEYEFLGASSEKEVLGKSDLEHYPNEESAIMLAEDDRVFSGEPIINLETLNKRKDGSRTWLMISKMPLKNELGEIVGLVGISLDITERKLAQEELARKEKLYRLVSENSHDVVSLHKLDGTFEYISPSCIELHGYPPEELIGRKGIEFIFPEDAESILSGAQELRGKMERNETIEPSQFRITTKNRGLVWAESVMKPVFADGKLTGFQSTVRDISVRKAYEKALQDAKVKAEGATLAKSQFLSIMSHEIRTPMNAIIGLTNLMLEEHPLECQKEKLNLLKFSGENLLTLINDILDFSKIEAGKIELENIAFSLPDILQKYVALSTSHADDKGIELKLEMPQQIPSMVIGDPTRLGQVLNNLIGNAIKFTQQGSVTLIVSVSEKSQQRCVIHFSIRDTGIVIKAEKISSIFENFTQASGDTTRKYGGTGLGLSIAKKLLEHMGSEIGVRSEFGVGTEFTFDIPFNISENSEQHGAIMQDEMVLENTLRVLLVEDNLINQIVAGNFLKKWGMDTTIANDGKEALEKIQSKTFDLVLMDLQMPVMDGYEATQIIRSYPDSYFKSVPIFALSASAMIEEKQMAMESGFSDFVTKPFQPMELKKKIILSAMKLRNQSVKSSFTS